jgi:hypothetical protein
MADEWRVRTSAAAVVAEIRHRLEHCQRLRRGRDPMMLMLMLLVMMSVLIGGRLAPSTNRRRARVRRGGVHDLATFHHQVLIIMYVLVMVVISVRILLMLVMMVVVRLLLMLVTELPTGDVLWAREVVTDAVIIAGRVARFHVPSCHRSLMLLITVVTVVD